MTPHSRIAAVLAGGPLAGLSLDRLAAAMLSIAHMLATARAASNMARVRRAGGPGELQQAFDSFERWQAVRAVLQALAFVTNIWALIALLGGLR